MGLKKPKGENDESSTSSINKFEGPAPGAYTIPDKKQPKQLFLKSGKPRGFA